MVRRCADQGLAEADDLGWRESLRNGQPAHTHTDAEFSKDVAAMANTRGGFIILGMTNQVEFKGIRPASARHWLASPAGIGPPWRQDHLAQAAGYADHDSRHPNGMPEVYDLPPSPAGKCCKAMDSPVSAAVVALSAATATEISWIWTLIGLTPSRDHIPILTHLVGDLFGRRQKPIGGCGIESRQRLHVRLD